MSVAAQVAVHDRLAWVVAHSRRADDMAGALEVFRMLDFAGVQMREDLVVNFPRVIEPRREYSPTR